MAKTKSKTKRAGQIVDLLEELVFGVRTRDDVFNLYADAEPAVDLPEAAEIRRGNLTGYVGQMAKPSRLLIVGQSPRWRAGRFTGIPFTSQAQLLRPDFPVQGERSSLGPNPLSDKTATQVWKALLPYGPELFFWHAFPLHAHRPGATLTNRTPSRQELQEFVPVLEGLHDILKPRHVLGVGRSASLVLEILDVEHSYVRHPAYAGVRAFNRGVKEALEPQSEDS